MDHMAVVLLCFVDVWTDPVLFGIQQKGVNGMYLWGIFFLNGMHGDRAGDTA